MGDCGESNTNARGSNKKGLILSEIIKANVVDKKSAIKNKKISGTTVPRAESKSSLGKNDTLKLGTT